MSKRYLAVILENLRNRLMKQKQQMRTIIREINNRGFSSRIQNVAADPR